MKVIIIGNYPPDKQESMKLFSTMLNKGLINKGIDAEIWVPSVFFGYFSKSTIKGLGKWLGYLDKWVLFPIILRIRLLKNRYRNGEIRFHICDHSNSPYLAHLPLLKSAITCHDVLAIRGAFGFEDAYCTPSKFGLILQKWIFKNLLKADKIATVSELTLNQLKDLSIGINAANKNWQVIHNAFNGDFGVLPKDESTEKMRAMGFSDEVPFLLHVGSSLERKNRKLLVDMLIELGDKWNGIVCFAGEEIDPDLASYINSRDLHNRVKSIQRPTHQDLLALYCSCEAFVFPSFSEGFGWPLIEAQACGVPVIASNIAPMPEVSGGAALHASPYHAKDFADAFLSLKDLSLRDRLISNGFENCKRFSLIRMTEAYISLFNLNRN